MLSAAGNIPGSESTVADVVCHHFDIRPTGNVDPSNVISIYQIRFPFLFIDLHLIRLFIIVTDKREMLFIHL